MNEMIFLSLSRQELMDLIKAAIKEELNQKKEKELLSFKEMCKFLGCSVSGLNKWKSENKIPYKKLGKRVFFSRSEVVEALKNSNYFKLRELQ
jgi:excisionase family DNA binding protein